MTLGQRIQHHRTLLELSQEGLGEKLGVSRQAVSKWEADGAVPDTDKLIALSKLFGITLNELLQVAEPPKAQPEASSLSTSLEEVSTSEELPVPENLPAKPAANLHRRTTLLTVAVLILAVAVGICGFGIAGLREEVSALKSEVAASNTVSAGLDPNAPLVSDFDFEINQTSGLSSSNRLFKFDLLPYQIPEELEVTFSVRTSSDHVARTVEATREAGGHYTAAFSLEALPPLTFTATFSDGIKEYAIPLVRLTSVGKNTSSWKTLWNQENSPLP